MRLAWPITDPHVGYLDLINAALDDYEAVVARLGYIPAGLPRDWEIQTIRRRPGRAERNELTCVVEVARLAREAA
jgi:hypothetical protein